MTNADTNLVHVTKEFIEENKKTNDTQQKKNNGGPYTKNIRQIRRDGVYTLHFEYGYSARKIADILKISRNTINGDINYWFDKIGKKTKLIINPEIVITKYITRLELQRTRLREALEKTKVFHEKLVIEKLIFDIESKVMQTILKVTKADIKQYNVFDKEFDELLLKEGIDNRREHFFDLMDVSDKSYNRIREIIIEDQSKKKN